jgi:hypothetical protein
MNRAKFGAFKTRVLATRDPVISGANSAQMPNGDPRFAIPSTRTEVVFTALIGGDPNSNGGLDSNGYQQCYLVTYEFGMTGTSQWPEARLDVTDTNSPSANFGAKAFVYSFRFSFTHDSPDPTDDGFLLLKPTVASATAQMAKGQLTGTLTLGGSVNVSVAVAINSTVSGTIVVHDSNSDFTGTSGKHCLCVYDTTHARWDFIWVAC